MRIKKTKALRYVVATFLTMGTVLSVGFLSFSGLWIIYPYVIPAILAFFLSGVIEGKVFGTSIFKGLARLKLLTSSAEKHLLFSELNKLLGRKNEDWLTDGCEFLKDYWGQRKHYKKLKNDFTAKEEEITDAKKKLEELKDYFYEQLKKPNDASDTNSYISLEFKNASINELKSARRSVWFLRFFWIISVSVGVVSGFVTAFAVQEAITVGLALSLSATAVSAIVWPVALFAAIGATFLLYYAITDIVKNDAIEQAFSKTLELFKRKISNDIKEPLGAYLFRLLALSIVALGIISLTVFATAASGGTCWIVMQKGINLLAPKLPVVVAYCASTILIPINFATDLIYGFSTTLQTIDNSKNIFIAIFEGIKHPIKAIKTFCSRIETKLDKVKQNESWGQFFNPFRILAKLIISPLQSLVFIGHLISIGLTTDRFMNVPPPLVAGVCAASEGLQDLSFLTAEEDHNHDHAEDGHDHGNLLQLPLQALLSPLLIIAGISYWAIKKYGSEVSFFDAIKQTFELPLLNIVFFPLLLPSAIWHWIFKKETNNLTFFESIKQSFEIHTHEHACVEESTFELSKEWRETRRPQMILTNAAERLNSVWIDKNKAIEKQNYLKYLTSGEGLTSVVANLDVLYYLKDVDHSVNSKPQVNGYIREHSDVDSREKQKSSISILNKRRSLLFNTESKETTTSRMVRDAFNLVAKG